MLDETEYDLLWHSTEQSNIHYREQLLDRVEKQSASETNIVDVYTVTPSKIPFPGQESYIKTVRGIGYSMQVIYDKTLILRIGVF